MIQTAWGETIEEAPYSYQKIDGKQKEVQIEYEILNKNTFGFKAIENYNKNQALVIDPYSLIWSTLLAGSGSLSAFVQVADMIVAQNNEVVASGVMVDFNFPTTPGSYQNSTQGNRSAFVTRLKADGSDIVYSVILGGNSGADGVVLSNNEEVILTGSAQDNTFPTTLGALKTNLNDSADAFVTRISANGSNLMFSTFLGGSGLDDGRGVQLALNEDVVICGNTTSNDFPTSNNAYQISNNNIQDVFITRLSADGSSIVYSTFVGGSDVDITNALQLTSNEDVVICGQTISSDFPTTSGAFQTQLSNNISNAFITKLSSDGSTLVYSTFLSGSGSSIGGDNPIDIDLYPNNDLLITGVTSSSDFPTTSDAYQINYGGMSDAFVTRLSSDGSNLVYSTFFGGSDFDRGGDIQLITDQDIAFTGATYSNNFPITNHNAFQISKNDSAAAFMTTLSGDGQTLTYSSFLGGNSTDISYELITKNEKVWICGLTASSDFPTTPSSFLPFSSADIPGFISRFDKSCVTNTLNVSATSTDDLNNLGNGSATVNVTGGNAPIAYLWSNGFTTSTISGLFPGEYQVTVTDVDSCQVENVVIVSGCANNTMDIEVQSTPSNQNANNGSATVSFLTQGTAPYMYEWGNNQTTQTISGLPSGTYTVTVYDANFCSVADFGVIGEVSNNLNCANAVTLLCNVPYSGTASTAASGVYSYGCNTWSETGPERVHTYTPTENGPFGVKLTNYTGDLDIYILGSCDPADCLGQVFSDSAHFANGIADTTYYLVVDADDGSGSAYDILVTGCVDTVDCSGFSFSLTGTNETAPSANDCAAAVVNITGGASPFTYSWSNGATTDNISNVPAGTYGVTVTDGQNCSATHSITLELYTGIPCESLQLNIQTTNESDTNANDGSAIATALGGNPPYSYVWSNGEATSAITNLSPDLYSLTVTDANNCVSIDENVVIYAAGENLCNMSSIMNSTDETAQGANDGTVSVTPVNGTAPFSYIWNTGDSIAYLTNLSPDVYVVTITDSNNCSNVNVAVIEAYSDSASIGVNLLIEHPNFKVFPNPVKDVLTVVFESKSNTKQTLEVLNNLGQVVLTKNMTLNKTQENIPVQTLANGTYHLKVSNQYATKSISFVVDR